MNDLNEQAKKIIAKGKVLNDPELIKMGLDMLDAYAVTEDTTEDEPVKSTSIRSPISTAGKFDMGQFTMSKATSNVIDKNGKKQPIYVGARENKYIDDGKEHKDGKNITPDVELATRNRAPVEKQKKEQKCEVCGKIEKVLPLYVRDFYRCESCLLKGKS